MLRPVGSGHKNGCAANRNIPTRSGIFPVYGGKGVKTDHCVSTTARTAANLGFETVVVTDATATFDREGPSDVELSARESHDAALAHLHEEFASIVDTADLL